MTSLVGLARVLTFAFLILGIVGGNRAFDNPEADSFRSLQPVAVWVAPAVKGARPADGPDHSSKPAGLHSGPIEVLGENPTLYQDLNLQRATELPGQFPDHSRQPRAPPISLTFA